MQRGHNGKNVVTVSNRLQLKHLRFFPIPEKLRKTFVLLVEMTFDADPLARERGINPKEDLDVGAVDELKYGGSAFALYSTDIFDRRILSECLNLLYQSFG